MSQLQPVSAVESHQQPTLSRFLRKSPEKEKTVSSSRLRLKESPGRSSCTSVISSVDDIIPSSSRTSNVQQADCPICQNSIFTDSEFIQFNRHIDECLNQPVLIGHEEVTQSTNGIKRCEYVRAKCS